LPSKETLRHQPAAKQTAAKRIVGSHGIWQIRGCAVLLFLSVVHGQRMIEV
jgi:hypothetical protein